MSTYHRFINILIQTHVSSLKKEKTTATGPLLICSLKQDGKCSSKRGDQNEDNCETQEILQHQSSDQAKPLQTI